MSGVGFSYAQAARGQSISQAQTAPALSTTPTPSPAAQDKDRDDDILASVPQNGLSAASPLTIDINKAFAKSLSLEAGSSPRKAGSDAPTSPAASSTMVGTLAESSSNFSLDDSKLHAAASDKPSRVSATGSRSPSSDSLVRKGGQRTKASTKTVDKDDEHADRTEEDKKDKEASKVALAPAPLPAVNIWSKRMQEQAAKAKQAPTPAPSKPAMTAHVPTGNGQAVIHGTKGKDAKKQAAVFSERESAPAAESPSSSNTKTQAKRSNEGVRAGNEQPRRNGTRGNRTTEKDEKTMTPRRDSLPSVHDAVIWPTPESAAATEDIKVKSTVENAEAVDKAAAQDDAATSKSRKKGWLPLPFVPSVNFQTPIPNVRGSKSKSGNRGGRDYSSRNGYNGNTGNGALANEKTALAVSQSADILDFETREPAKDGSGNGSAQPTRAPSHALTHKRFTMDGPHNHARDPRKLVAATLPDKPKEFADDQHTLTSKVEPAPKGANGSSVNNDTGGHHNQAATHVQLDRRSPSTPKNVYHHHTPAGKDWNSQEHKDPLGFTIRERAEARGDRPTRGGFRTSRGGSSTQHQHIGPASYQLNGQRATPNTAFNANSTILPPTATPFSPTSQQFPFGNTHNGPRLGARNSSRGQLPPQNPVLFSGRLQNGVGNTSRLSNQPSHGGATGHGELQTQPYPFPAFNPYIDSELLHGLTLQVEYYFSLDNLCKDVYLRRKMNDQGFVPLLIIAKFKRMSELAPSLDFIRAACEQSESLDYIQDQDQKEWIRSRYLWNGFILPPEDRDEEARRPGPDLRTVIFRSAHHRPPQVYLPNILSGGYPSLSPSVFQGAYSVNGTDLLYPVYDGGIHSDYNASISNGAELNGHLHRDESQLSAAVPDFSPGGQGGAPTTLEDYQTYPDEQVEKLVVLLGSDVEPASGELEEKGLSFSQPRGSSQLAKRSHVNGSGINGSSGSNGAHEGSSSTGEDIRLDNNGLQPVGRKVGERPYPELRAEALEQRLHAKPGETPPTMRHLYRFWSHCLPDRFNVRMYEDFRSFAMEDARCSTPSDMGLNCLLRYYDHVLFTSKGARPYPAVFMPHYAEAKQLSESPRGRVNGEPRA